MRVKKDYVKYTLRLEPATIGWITQTAIMMNMSNAEFIRHVINHYRDEVDGESEE